MESLNKIQKVFRVFMILTKVGMIVSFVAAGLAAAFCELFNAPQSALADWSSASSISLGVVLILASLIFRYGAELENKA